MPASAEIRGTCDWYVEDIVTLQQEILFAEPGALPLQKAGGERWGRVWAGEE